jgi:regulator of nonsense transcripts 2
MLAFGTSKTAETTFPPLGVDAENELVEKDIRDRFKKMCEGYFENVAKKLVLEHKVSAPTFYTLDCCDITIL